MRQKKTERRKIVSDFIQQFYEDNVIFPSEKEISIGTGIPAASVHRILVDLRDMGELSYEGRRGARTERLSHISNEVAIPVLGTVACGPGEEEEERFIEYIHMSERLVGKGKFFALIAKGESMVGEGVRPGDYVIVRRQQEASDGDLVIALLDGMNNLKKLVFEDGKCILRSHNKKEAEKYPDIVLNGKEELQIRGIVVGVFHGC